MTWKLIHKRALRQKNKNKTGKKKSKVQTVWNISIFEIHYGKGIFVRACPPSCAFICTVLPFNLSFFLSIVAKLRYGTGRKAKEKNRNM